MQWAGARQILSNTCEARISESADEDRRESEGKRE